MKNSLFKVLSFIIIPCHFLSPPANAQAPSAESSLECLNNFSRYTSVDLNAESALFCLRKISTDKLAATRLPSLIHDGFVQGIADRGFPVDIDSAKVNSFRRVQSFGKRLMATIMADTNQILKQVVNPMYLFSNISDAADNQMKLTSLTDRFIREELSDPDIYSNRAGRYALMIYPIINSKPELKPLAGKLLEKVNAYLENGQVTTSEKTTKDELERRAWYRYLYAYLQGTGLPYKTAHNPRRKISSGSLRS